MRVMTHFLLWAVRLSKPESQTSLTERKCLARYAAGKRRLVEIGVWEGATTTVLRRAMASDGILFAVDPYPVGRLGFSAPQVIAHKELATVCNGTVKWLRSTGEQAAFELSQNREMLVDFVFIDGDHSYDGLRIDWEAWSPLVERGGIVALHDSRSSAGRPIDDAGSAIYTREVILTDPRFKVVEFADTLTILSRRS